MEPQRFSYPDITGGLNEGQPATEIADREFTLLDNFYPFGRKLIRRGGTYLLSPNGANTKEITGIFNLNDADEVLTTVVAGPTAFAKLDTGAFTALTNEEGIALPPDDKPWSMLQYKNVGYAMREVVGLRRFTATYHAAAGLVGPISAPTLADGGASGVHVIATYRGVVTFVDGVTGLESNPSSEGVVALGTTAHKIAWSAIPISPSTHVTARRLYRTVPGGEGIYLFVAEIGDNTTTIYTDDISIDELGDAASFDNGLPPVAFCCGDVWNERLFATDGEDVYPSEPFMPEAFSGDKIRVFPDDGHKITAIHADGSRLIIGKTNKIHYLTAAGDDFALATLSDKHGVYSHHSMKSAEGLLLWYGGDSFYRAFGGGSPESIATIKIKDTLALIPDARKEYVVSAIYPKYGWYISAVTVGDFSYNNKILCYNYKADVWNTFTIEDASPAYIAEVFGPAYEQILYCSLYDGNLYQFDRGLTDAGNLITASFRTKAFRWGLMGLMSCLRRFFIRVTPVAASATFSAYPDESNTAQTSRTVSLYQNRPTQGVNLSTLDQAAGSWQLGMSYTGEPAIEIEGLAVEAVPFSRRVKVS